MGKLRSYRSFLLVLVLILSTGAVLNAEPTRPEPKRPAFGKHDKAYYLPDSVAVFVRPGLVLKILDASIGSDGSIKAHFTITDPKGLPLDMAGVFTPGTVSVSFVAGTIPNGQKQYLSYTFHTVTAATGGATAVQATTDSGGVFTTIAQGEYTYTFKTKVPATYTATDTHSIGAYASRVLTEFDLGTQYSDAVYTWVPSGAKVTTTRDVVETSTCNQCHDPLSAHGGARTEVGLCVMCHTPQSTDPNTGNTVNFPVMIHKIHAGSSLPSVVAGGKYQIVGYQNRVSDFSTVVFPNDLQNCSVCHKPGAAQANAYLIPNRAACGACHDDVNFATGQNHVSLPQQDDTNCATCHIPQGDLEFDASILGAHTVPRFSKQIAGINFNLIKVDNGVAGKSPTVTFSVKDNSGNPIAPSTMNRLALVIAGPTSDYAGMTSEDATKATCGQDGTCTYTFAYQIPATATGTYSIGIEGRNNYTLNVNTPQSMVVEVGGTNKVISFSVDGSPLQPRRTVVSIDSCNQCHGQLTVHGANRNQVVMCVLCHNPNGNDSAYRPAAQNPPQTIDFRTMIHKIHSGTNLTNDYTIYGFGNSVNNFNGVLFPGDTRDCEKCHVNSSEQLPLASNLLPVQTPRAYIKVTQPTAAACLACHDTQTASVHAAANTNVLGESCVVCHGPTADYSIDQVHAR